MATPPPPPHYLSGDTAVINICQLRFHLVCLSVTVHQHTQSVYQWQSTNTPSLFISHSPPTHPVCLSVTVHQHTQSVYQWQSTNTPSLFISHSPPTHPVSLLATVHQHSQSVCKEISGTDNTELTIVFAVSFQSSMWPWPGHNKSIFWQPVLQSLMYHPCVASPPCCRDKEQTDIPPLCGVYTLLQSEMWRLHLAAETRSKLTYHPCVASTPCCNQRCGVSTLLQRQDANWHTTLVWRLHLAEMRDKVQTDIPHLCGIYILLQSETRCKLTYHICVASTSCCNQRQGANWRTTFVWRLHLAAQKRQGANWRTTLVWHLYLAAQKRQGRR